MKKCRFCSIFAITVGVVMFIMWVFFLLAGMVPELQTRPAEIILHLIAEFSTAALLVIAGISMALNSKSSRWLYPLASGMLFYTVIVSPGYYIQSGDYALPVMFLILLLLNIVSLFIFAKKNTL